MNLISLFVSSFLTSNVVLNKFLGICPFMGTSKKEKNAIYMGISVTLVILLSSIVTFLIYEYILVPTDTVYLKTIMFILVIAFMVQLLETILKKYFNKIYKTLGLYLPLITTNCAVLGVTLLNVSSGYNFIEMLIYSLGSGLGFTFVIYLFSTIRKRIEINDLGSFNGIPIAFVVASIMALIFSRFSGI